MKSFKESIFAQSMFFKVFGLNIIFTSLVIAYVAIAAPVPIKYQQVDVLESLTDVALNGAVGTRTTGEILVQGLTQATVYIKYDRGATAAATAITLTCTAGMESGELGEIDILYDGASLGTSNSYHHTWRKVVAADEIIRWVITPLNDKYLKCIVGSEGIVTADDVIKYVRFRTGVI